jgi:hypothetical protein
MDDLRNIELAGFIWAKAETAQRIQMDLSGIETEHRIKANGFSLKQFLDVAETIMMYWGSVDHLTVTQFRQTQIGLHFTCHVTS